MAFAIGYNVKQANELMNKIEKAYKDLGLYAKDQWNPVVNVLQNEWVGDDEQDFENKLAKRICELYVKSYELVNYCFNQIAGTAQAWYEFQSKNIIGEGVAEVKSKFDIDIPTIKAETEIVKAKPKTISNNDDRGLRSEGSKGTIQTSVTEFVNGIKAKTTGLFEDIETNNAFFGEQSSSIKGFVENVGKAVAEVTVAVKDMYEALDTLAASSYTSAATDVGQSFSTAQQTVSDSLNDLGSSRWN